MLISLNDALKRAKDNGATENPGIFITAKLKPRWLAWILHRLFLTVSVEVSIDYGEIEDGRLIKKGSATWNAK